MSEENKPEVTRRRLLRRAGTLAAGAGVAGVASAALGSPAQAADGGPVVIGGNNTGTATTSLTAGNRTTVTLNLANAADGPSLTTKVVTTDVAGNAPFDPEEVAPGTVFADQFGDMHVVGEDEIGSFSNMMYSPTWAYMTVPWSPLKIVHTWDGFKGPGSGLPTGLSGRHYLEGGRFDSFGRVEPLSKMDQPNPDLVINLRAFVPVRPEYAAVQGVLIVENTLKRAGDPAAPFLGMWDEGPYPFSTTLSYHGGVEASSTFVQVPLGRDGKVRLKLSSPALVVFDIVGWVIKDPIVQLAEGPSVAGARARTNGKALRTTPLRKG